MSGEDQVSRGGVWGQTEFQVNLKLGLTPRRPDPKAAGPQGGRTPRRPGPRV